MPATISVLELNCLESQDQRHLSNDGRLGIMRIILWLIFRW